MNFKVGDPVRVKNGIYHPFSGYTGRIIEVVASNFAVKVKISTGDILWLVKYDVMIDASQIIQEVLDE